MGIKGVIFDLDGTLLDSLGDVCDFANAVLVTFGFEQRQKEDYRYLAGQGAYNLMKAASGCDSEILTLEMASEFSAVYSQLQGSSAPYPNISLVLECLDALGIKKAILSNKPEHLTQKCVSKYLSEFDFEAVFGERDGIDVKPNPALGYEIADLFGLKPSEIAIIGDTKNDILTAKNGGFYSIGVTWGFRDRAELEESGADAIVDSPQQMCELFWTLSR